MFSGGREGALGANGFIKVGGMNERQPCKESLL